MKCITDSCCTYFITVFTSIILFYAICYISHEFHFIGCHCPDVFLPQWPYFAAIATTQMNSFWYLFRPRKFYNTVNSPEYCSIFRNMLRISTSSKKHYNIILSKSQEWYIKFEKVFLGYLKIRWAGRIARIEDGSSFIFLKGKPTCTAIWLWNMIYYIREKSNIWAQIFNENGEWEKLYNFVLII